MNLRKMDFTGKKTIDLTAPQRQAPLGVLVEMAYAFQKTIKALWPLLLVITLRVKDLGFLNTGLIYLSILIIIILLGYLNYRNFLFRIDEEENTFIINKGILNKKQIVIGFSKIQQVNINQSFIKKLLNLYEVEIETAGSTKKEAVIKVVSKPVAVMLRERLIKEERILDTGVEDLAYNSIQPKENRLKPVVKISLGSLVKIAVTSDYIKSLGLIAAFFIALYDKVKDIFFSDQTHESEFFNYLYSLKLSNSLLLIVAGMILLVFVFNLVRMTIIYFDFTIRKENKSLLLSYGLFNTRNTIIQPAKVQIVKVVTNYFQRKMNLRRLVVFQASSDIVRDKKATINIPGCSKLESENIMEFVFNHQPQKGFMLKPDIRRVLSSVYKFILFPVLIFLVLTTIQGNWIYFWIISLSYIFIASALIYVSFQNNRLFVHEDFIIKKSGIWDIDTEILAPFKIQAISTKQNFWHVNSNIGHLVLHTAGGDLVFKFGDFATIKKYVNYWLYQVETSDKEWM